MAQKWTILSINPSTKLVTVQSASGKVLVVPMGSDPKDLDQQQKNLAAALQKREKEDKVALIKKVVLCSVAVILIAVSIVRTYVI